jgi:acyl-CoA synthetase (AMP-forming)/AMP-acid ligase II
MRGARVRVVDPVTLADCPVGERGEVLVAGSRIMKGYWRKPEQTAEVILPDGWLRTGDGRSFDADGFIYPHDRLKDMIVSGGENVYPAEVESVMTRPPRHRRGRRRRRPLRRLGRVPPRRRRPAPRCSSVGSRPDQLDPGPPSPLQMPVGVTFPAGLARTASGKLQKQAIRSSLAAAAVS